jgi:hypothetical protein
MNMFSARYPLNFLNCGSNNYSPHVSLGAADLELNRQ